MGVSLSGVVGKTRPGMVLETRADTVTRLGSGETEELWGLAEVLELSEQREWVAVRCGFVPFAVTSGVFVESVLFSAPFTVMPGDAAIEGEEGLGVSVTALEAPPWTGGRGARYLTLASCDCGVSDCVLGEACFAGGVPDGIGGAGALTDLGLEASGLGWGASPDSCWLRGPEEGCSWADGSAGR